jgi:flagellar hook protein FlgE
MATDGLITALYDNGQRRPAGQALLARFALADRLLRVGNTGLRCVSECGSPIVAPPGYMMLGTLVATALEEGF